MTRKFDICLDSEGDNLIPLTTTIHCVVIKIIGMEGDSAFRTIMDREGLLRVIPHVNKVIMANGLGYDLPAFRRVWSIPYSVSANGKDDTWAGHPVTFIDTLHLSQFLSPDRGGHSVEAWAERLTGVPQKVQNEDWSKFTPLMLERCRSDVIITEAIYHALLKESETRNDQQ